MAIRRFAGAKIPDGRVTLRQAHDRAILWIEAANFRTAAGEFRFEVAVEVISVGTLRLEFPRDLRARKFPREQDVTVARPSGHVRTAATVLRPTVGRRKPVGLSIRQDP